MLLRRNHSIVGPHWEGQARPKGFNQQLVLRSDDSTPAVNIVLCEGHFGGQRYLFVIYFLNLNVLCLVASGPYDQICLFDVFTLVDHTWALDQLDSLLHAFPYLFVQSLGVTP